MAGNLPGNLPGQHSCSTSIPKLFRPYTVSLDHEKPHSFTHSHAKTSETDKVEKETTNSLLKKRIHLLRAINLNMSHIFRRERDIEVVELVIVCVCHLCFSLSALLFLSLSVFIRESEQKKNLQ
jgi:hypothetical protein